MTELVSPSAILEKNEKLEATGAQLAIAALEAHGVDTIFGIPGVHTLALYDALRDSSIRHVLARHEQGVGFMADGYARASGRPGVACVITGPGITNIATPIGEAYTDSSPVLVISSNNRRSHVDAMRGNLHDLKDQLGVMAAVTKWNTRVMSAGESANAVADGFRAMGTGRPLPVHIEFPLDVLDESSTVEEIPVARPERLRPDPELLRKQPTGFPPPNESSSTAAAALFTAMRPLRSSRSPSFWVRR